MRHIAIIAALACGAPTFALAADLAMKAPKYVAGYPYEGTGCYKGLNTQGEASKVEVTGAQGSTGQLIAASGGVGFTLGCVKGQGTSFIAGEIMGDYKNLGASNSAINSVPGSINSKWSFEARAKFGGPMQVLLGLLPNLGSVFPAFPPVSVVTVNSHPYIAFGVRTEDVTGQLGLNEGRAWQVAPTFAVGVMQQLPDRTVADVWISVSPAASGFVLGGDNSANANMGRKVVAGAGWYF